MCVLQIKCSNTCQYACMYIYLYMFTYIHMHTCISVFVCVSQASTNSPRVRGGHLQFLNISNLQICFVLLWSPLPEGRCMYIYASLTYIYIYIYVFSCVYVRVFYIYMFLYTYIYAHLYTNTYIHIHLHMCVWVCYRHARIHRMRGFIWRTRIYPISKYFDAYM